MSKGDLLSNFQTMCCIAPVFLITNFCKTTAWGQTVLPDGSLSLGQLVENALIKKSNATILVIFEQCAS